jgi:hypothetical protein
MDVTVRSSFIQIKPAKHTDSMPDKSSASGINGRLTGFYRGVDAARRLAAEVLGGWTPKLHPACAV